MIEVPSRQSNMYMGTPLALLLLACRFDARTLIHDDQVVAKMCLDRSDNFADLDRGVEAHLVKGWHHRAWSKIPQRASALSGRARATLRCNLAEIFAGIYARLRLQQVPF